MSGSRLTDPLLARWSAFPRILQCPVCRAELLPEGRGLTCPSGHRFDLAKQGYVSLLTGAGTTHRSDTAEMVASRRRVVDAGLYSAIEQAVVDAACRDRPPGSVLDAGAGTGHYLAAVLSAAPEARGVGIDLSKYCARAAAKAHPAAVAAVADLWHGLPLTDGSVDVVLSVFAPRNISETARVLTERGRWVIVTPNPGHLGEIVEPMGMLRVGEDKTDRLHAELHTGGFTVDEGRRVVAELELDAAQIADVAGMGPAGFHRSPEQLGGAAAALARDGRRLGVTLDVTVSLAQMGDSPAS